METNLDLLQIYLGASELLQNGAVWLAQDGHILGANGLLAKDLGYEQHDLQDKSIFQINPRLNLLEWRRIWKNLEEAGSCEIAGDHIRADGRLYPIKMTLVLVDLSKQFACIGIVTNQLTLSRYRDMLELVSQMTKIGAYEWDLLSNELIVTDQLYEILHLDRTTQPITAENFRNYLDHYLSSENRQLFREVARGGMVQGAATQFEFKVPLDDGAVKTMLIYVHPVNNEETTLKVFGAIHDITPQKQALQPLELTQYALDNAAEMVYWLDHEGHVVYANHAIAARFGYTKQEMEQLTVYDIVPSIRDIGWEHVFNTIKKQGHLELNRDKRHRDGSDFTMQIVANYIEHEGRPVICKYVRELSSEQVDARESHSLKIQLANALDEISMLKNEIEASSACLNCELAGQFNYHNIITCSERYKTVLAQVEQVASTDATVLVTGETGTGKELIARAIHINSPRGKRPMVKVNCAALPENLIESELFGHEKGAFTGAIQRKPGRFELADRSSLFLDEIGELPLDLQTKLLRVLQEGEFERVGGTETLRTNVRVIAATNRDLADMVQKGTFRQDLFYRLNVFPIHNIPLRERPEDVPLLIQHFTKKFADKMGKHIPKIPQRVITVLEQYPFPGNIRELENIIERAVILTSADTLHLDPNLVRKTNGSLAPDGPGGNGQFLPLDEMQRQHIQQAIEKCKGRISGPDGAARLLGLNDKTLFSKMAKLNISK